MGKRMRMRVRVRIRIRIQVRIRIRIRVRIVKMGWGEAAGAESIWSVYVHCEQTGQLHKQLCGIWSATKKKSLLQSELTLNSDRKECYNKIFLELQIERDTESERDTKRQREYMYLKYGAYFLGATSTNRIALGPDPSRAGTRNTIMILL